MKMTVTLTFGDQAENHVGMQKIGEMANRGFSIRDLKKAQTKFNEDGFETELINLNDALPEENDDVEEARILIVRKGVNAFTSSSINKLFREQSHLEFDKKALMYGRVVEKRARYNLCFGEESQEPDYENGKGRIIAFDDVPLLSEIRNNLPKFFGKIAKNLMIEGNYYYDVKKCGIGFHGDSERKIVIALRLGHDLPLHYQWFIKGNPIGDRVKLMLSHGDLYAMSEKATGYDWKMKRIIPTLRHAAGADKFLLITDKKTI